MVVQEFWGLMERFLLFAALYGLLVPGLRSQSQEGLKAPPPTKPPWQRMLMGADEQRAQELENRIAELRQTGKFGEAVRPAKELFTLRSRVQGETHWQAQNARRQLQFLEKVAALPAKAQAELAEAGRRAGDAQDLFRIGHYRDAVPLQRSVLEIRQRHLGPAHLEVARTLNALALYLAESGNPTQAEPLYQKVLALSLNQLGEDHPDTATSYNNLASNLNDQGKYTEAEPLFRRALAICLKVLGEDHADTAQSYNSVAANLNAQGKYAEAELLSRRALTTCLKVLGENHADTAQSYNNVAADLDDQGKYAEAEPLYRRALIIKQKVLGEDHLLTATGYNNAGYNLNAQGKYAEAEPLFRRALAIRLKVLGEDHPLTALSYNNLAGNLDQEGKYAQAEPLFRRVLASKRKLWGEDHPETARGYNNVAMSLSDQGKYLEAEPLHRQALTLFQKLLGNDHPRTAMSYHNLAGNLNAQGRSAEAEPLCRRALAIHLKVLGEDHPDTAESYNNVAYNLNAQGKYAQAGDCWTRAAQSFGVARLRSSPTGLERAAFATAHVPWPDLAACQGRLGKPLLAWQSLEAGLGRGLLDDLSAHRMPVLTPSERQHQEALSATLDRLDRQVSAVLQIQPQTQKEQLRFRELVQERQSAQMELARLAGALADRQVYDRRRIQAQLPADAAWIACVDLKALPHAADSNGEHWACVLRHEGEPVWIRLPGSGPGRTWTEEDDDLLNRFRLAVASPPGQFREDREVITRQLYAQRLAPLEPALRATHGLPDVRRLFVCPVWWLAGVPVEALTDRYIISYVPSGTLLAMQEEKRQASLPRGSAVPRLLALGDPAFRSSNGYARLPGTRQEVQAIARWFGQPLVLLDSEASSQRLEALAQRDELRGFRYLHFATHGELNHRVALQSALILASGPQSAATTPTPVNSPGLDERLTAARMLEWKLDAELVTLSACQSGLGKQAGGEGFLGFAQALFLAGARSVVMSLWKVDDTATALLMTRFYQNLLGKRDGLKQPLPKAEALQEAKQWLRELTATEVEKLQDDLRAGRLGTGQTSRAAVDTSADQPYAHPHFWAAFILIGHPH